MSVIPAPDTIAWRKSSYSDGGQNNCVEVADGIPALVPVRDSKRPQGPAVPFAAPAWVSFVASLKSGELSAQLP